MEGNQRDGTQDWVIPRGAVPTLNQLEARIDEALVIARVSEDGVREVGEMALDAARQARRAAEAAEVSAEAAVEARDEARRPAGPVTPGGPPPLPGAKASSGAGPPTAPPAGGARFDVRFRSFTERADQVSARLRRLGAHPSHSAPSVGAARRRGDG